MSKMYYDADADLGLLKGKTVAIIGYGNQGHAHALNLKESGIDVVVAEPAGTPGFEQAKAAGFVATDAADATARADIITMLLPGAAAPRRLPRLRAARALKPGKTLMFAHGFNVHYGQVVPPADIDVIMVAPKSPGNLVREIVCGGQGRAGVDRRLPGRHGQGERPRARIRQGHRLHARRRLGDRLRRGDRERSHRRAVRSLRRRPALIKAGFDTLVEAGYRPSSPTSNA